MFVKSLCGYRPTITNLELPVVSASATSIFIANGTSSTNGTAAFTITPSATATVVPLVFTFTTTVSTTGFDTIDLPDGSIRHHVTLSGPTTYIVTYSVPSDLYTGVIDVAGPDIYTDTEVLDEGTVTIEVIDAEFKQSLRNLTLHLGTCRWQSHACHSRRTYDLHRHLDGS